MQRINEVLGTSHESSKKMKFELIPEGNIEKNSFDISFDNGYRAVISWDARYGVGDEIPFEFSFFDANGGLVKDVIYAFGLVDPQGTQFNLVTGDNPEEYVGVKSPEGIATHMIMIPDDSLYTINLVLTGEGFANYDTFLKSSQMFEVGISTAPSSSITSTCLLYTSPSPRDRTRSRMPSSA